VMAASFGSR